MKRIVIVKRIFNKIFISALVLFSVVNSVISAESEYKNSLMKVELLKQNENSYNINLYTQKKFLEPVKVIKKSDLNYYILLPETKNTASETLIPKTDIRSVSINLYPYMGQEVNNGYTKININTTKPINFNINVKQLSQNNIKKNTLAKNTQKTPNENKKQANLNTPQKKNQNFSKSSKSIKPSVKKQEKIEKQETKKEQPKKQVQNKKINKTDDTKNEPSLKTAPVLIPEPFEDENNQLQVQEENIENIEAEIIDNTKNDKIINEQKPDNFIDSFKKTLYQKYPSIYNLKQKIKNKFALLNISLKNFILMISASFLTFIFILFILTRKQNTTIKLKNKKDLFEKYQEPNISKQTTPKKQNRGEYFVFDKNIKQTRLNTSSPKKKNYELSCYDPDLRLNYKKDKNVKYDLSQDESDYDIIQKILKDDSFLDYEAEKTPVVSSTQKPKQIQKPKIEKTKKQAPIKKEARLDILSSVEIAPQRGFICVSYNNDINLLGYIFDDVFPLYNFKRPKLDNYDIKFRLTDKDDKGASFIVKIDNVKMVIRATKNSMNLEVLI